MNDKSRRICATVACVITFYQIMPARIVPGNTSGTESFTFSVGTQAHNAAGSIVFAGALQPGVANDFALSLWGFTHDQFCPFAPELVTLNGIADQVNPLFNSAIARLSVLGKHTLVESGTTLPISVVSTLPATLFFNLSSTQVLSVPQVVDALGNTTREIIAIEGFEEEAIFAAVKPSDNDNFGQPGSGIAVVQLVTTKIDDCPQTLLMQINAKPNSPGDEPLASALDITSSSPNSTADEPLASALDITSSSIKIGSDVVSIANAVDMWYSEHLKRLFIALEVEGGAGATDGARGVVVGRLIDRKLSFQAIAPDDVFTLQDKIVGGTGANTQISIHKVRTMRTTTGLDYLIVVGNVGAPGVTENQVFALPLINLFYLTMNTDSPIQGTLANVNVDPVDSFDTTDTCSTLPSVFIGRAFIEPAEEPDEVFTETSVEAIVGIIALPEGNITDINISNDVVFVSVADASANQLPGIFYSQALFDATGAVAAWTPWQRVAGTTDKVFNVIYRARLGNFAWFTGTNALNINTVKETQWGMGSPDGLGNLVTLLSELFPLCSAGVQGFFDLPLNTPGLFDISLYIATGLKKIALIQSGSIIAGTYTPTVGDFTTDLVQFFDGEITQNLPVGNSRVVAISGGALDTLGPIVASAIGVNNVTQNGYLFVGGACGLAVLAQPDGTGWSTLNALSTNLAGLSAGMRFTVLGAYCFVRKLIFDEGFLYVLTDTQLDRINIAASDFATGNLSVVTIATPADIGCVGNGTLLDVAVSHSFGLLASSNGLFRVGDNADIQTASNNLLVGWTEVVIPEGECVVQQIETIASNSLPNGFAKTANGNVYILDAYAGLDTAQENRYTVQSVVNQPITDTTIVPLPDLRVKNILTSFNRYTAFADLINFDGTDNFAARNRGLITNINLRDELFTIAPFVRNRGVELPLDIPDASFVTAITRSSASGAWLIAGDFGLRVNE